ncbi:aa3-type cytochrome c oxidase subunit IV [Aminobacter aganoensis]|uniref:Cation transport ATPase n=1 Tax=Aminobacter aganoensis TaxID=83264 RepID=A0A7X0FC17_9HYPH|nr:MULTISPECIES: aa3-type cytochrome c oxidase subunit IV [Aminobacter]KQU64900.1 cytochrome C oxidase subunit IV [Aminobacter sp. DSM 101952]MBB6356885.1 cation transport ATPase [Aminobacter aganoensis]
MADNTPTGPVELGAQMDYAEHEGTYNLFIKLSKYATLVCVALMVAMAFGFFTPAGFFSSTVLFLVLVAVGGFLLRDLPAHIS